MLVEAHPVIGIIPGVQGLMMRRLLQRQRVLADRARRTHAVQFVAAVTPA